MNKCPGCDREQRTIGMCGYCRVSVIQMRAARDLTADTLLDSVRALLAKYQTETGLDSRDVDSLMIAFAELDYRGVRGLLPMAWDYPDYSDEGYKPARPVENIISDRL